MNKILIIAPSWLGDIIMSQSLLKILKSQDPQCIIDVYAPAYTLPILKRMPEVDNYIINPFAHGALNLKQRFLEGKKLQKHNYNCVFVLPKLFLLRFQIAEVLKGNLVTLLLTICVQIKKISLAWLNVMLLLLLIKNR